MNLVPRNYAEIVRARRQARGWSQAELAKRIGMTNVTISRWEKGRVEPLPVFWAKFLEVVGAHKGEEHRIRKVSVPQALDFLGDGAAIRAMVEGERLAFGHLANPAFA